VIVFTHVPRTCGTAFIHRIASVVQIWHGPGSTHVSMDRHFLMVLEDPRRYELIAGHFGYCARSVLPGPLRFITILRDPIQRSLSYLKFVMANEPHYLYHHVRGMDLGEAVSDPVVCRVLNNAQCLRWLPSPMGEGTG